MSNLIKSENDINSIQPTQLFSKSLLSTLDCALEFAESTIDAVIDSDAVKSIPILNVIKAGVDVGKSVHQRYEVKKLLLFFQKLNAHRYDDSMLNMKEKLQTDNNYLQKESELALVALERFVDAQKSILLAEVFYFRISENITQAQYEELVYIIGQIHCADIIILKLIKDGNCKQVKNEHRSAINRLVANGIVYQENLDANGTCYNHYKVASIGKMLCNVAY